MKLLLTLWGILIFVGVGQKSNNGQVPNYMGETMLYSLRYGWLTVGEARISYGTHSNCTGAYLSAKAYSVGLVKWFKDVHYEYGSCMDTSTGLPVESSRQLVEGSYTDINRITYDRDIYPDSTIAYSHKTGPVLLPGDILDLLTGMYTFRANGVKRDLPLHHTDTIRTYFIDEEWDLIMKYGGIETIRTRYGHIECLKFYPLTIVGQFFNSNQAMTMWFTNDGKYIPVKIYADLKLGALHAEIKDYRKPVTGS